MTRAVGVRGGLLVLVLAAGCGGSSEEAVVKEQVELMSQMTAAYDKVTDEDSFKTAQAEVDKLRQKVEELKKKVDSWPEEKKKQVNEKYGTELQAAAQRLQTALKNASKHLSTKVPAGSP
jgi:hypothetical protein